MISANTSELTQQYTSNYFNDILKVRFNEYGLYRSTPKIPIIGTTVNCGLLSDPLGCKVHD